MSEQFPETRRNDVSERVVGDPEIPRFSVWELLQYGR